MQPNPDSELLDRHDALILTLTRASVSVLTACGAPIPPELAHLRDALAERVERKSRRVDLAIAEHHEKSSVPPPNPNTPFGKARLLAGEALSTLGRTERRNWR